MEQKVYNNDLFFILFFCIEGAVQNYMQHYSSDVFEQKNTGTEVK